VESYEAEPRLILGERFQRDGKEVAPDVAQAIRKSLEATGQAQFPAEDPVTLQALKPYEEKVAAYRKTVLATASEGLVRTPTSGPGPLIADSMRQAVPKAQVAILNFGGVRRDLPAGPISQGDVMEVLPFSSTLCLLELSGAELKRALEEDLEFLVHKFEGQHPLPLPYVSGLKLDVDLQRPAGSHITSLQVGEGNSAEPLDPARMYRVVVNSFEAGGGDGFATLKSASARRIETGIVDADAFSVFLQAKKTVSNPSEPRISVK
jgi:5'-nucleotidase